MILVDTSAWVEVLRGRHRAAFSALAPQREIVTCLPVVQEVLQGFDNNGVRSAARAALEQIPTLEEPLTRDVIEEAVRLFISARLNGDTVRSSVDCLIAACAIRNGATVLHRDRDFDKIARISVLRTLRLPG
jgi:predicted nucleic acid-binding protein